MARLIMDQDSWNQIYQMVVDERDALNDLITTIRNIAEDDDCYTITALCDQFFQDTRDEA